MGGEISKKAMEELANIAGSPWSSSVEEPTRPRKSLIFPDNPCIPKKTVVFGPCAGTDHGEAKQEGPRSHKHRYKNTYLRQTSNVVDGEGLEEALTRLLNRYSEERASNTPDFILAKFLINALDTFNIAVQEREKWYGRQVW
jgi:hypothetical protein